MAHRICAVVLLTMLLSATCAPAQSLIYAISYRRRLPAGRQVWPSKKWVAFIERRRKNYQEESHVWWKSLESGADQEMLVVPANTPGSGEPEKTLYVIGWTEP